MLKLDFCLIFIIARMYFPFLLDVTLISGGLEYSLCYQLFYQMIFLFHWSFIYRGCVGELLLGNNVAESIK